VLGVVREQPVGFAGYGRQQHRNISCVTDQVPT
jgi:hypothetical protein